MKSLIRIKSINFYIFLYVLIFSFLLIYTFFQSEIIYKGEQLGYYYKYYILFILSLFFLIISFFLSKKNKFFFVISLTTFIILLYTYEITHFYNPKFLKSYLSKTFKKENLNYKKEESKIDVIEKIKDQTKEDVVPSIFPISLINNNFSFEDNIFPLAGISNTTTVFCKEGKEYSIYKSDRYGFNNPDVAWEENNIKWLLIGDSFVHGACVNPGEDFASQIRLFTNQSALNLGMSANGPLIELATLREYIMKKKISNVLWFYFERNDLDDLKIEKKNKILIKYLDKEFKQNLYLQQYQIDKKLRFFLQSLNNKNPIKKNNAFQKIIRLQIIRDKLALDRGLNFKIDPIFYRVISLANSLVNEKEGKLFFIYLPDKERYSNNLPVEKNLYRKKEVIKLISQLNIEIIDIDEEFFLKQEDPLNFFADRIYGHYSAEGYNRISKTILEKINKNNYN